ncbi:S-adenosyl-L-methionine-dependent methyltransferase [Trichoderma citrinoviride]|uniref:DNA (cytosine-5-)-methyltransferase n=1 Tax=Trichoderma citrinoviride TaxID=58853 RepID=A0A2T4BM20_9HYPO|nr:S-adenosyl-L-methionine-dependent methyltransferase [Trichoderma citrinoviride]PTB70362.1 S-adenosyl-L-methionine-dependent methyltransferase [Trichoderma citrinoviride]
MPSRIIIDFDGDEEVQYLTSRTVASEGRSRASSSVTLGRAADDEDEEAEELVELFEQEVIDLTGHELEDGTHDLIHPGESPLERYREPRSGTQLSRGDLIQVENVELGNYTIDFVQVKIIASDRQGECKIRGIPFVRTRKLSGKLPKKTNEICMILHIQRRDDGQELPALLIDVPTISIVKKRELVMTNAIYPEHCYNGEDIGPRAQNGQLQQRLAESHGKLVCRWKFTIYFTMQRQSRATRPEEEVLERVQADDVPVSRNRVSDESLCNQWRGGRIKGGSWPHRESRIIDLASRSSSGNTALPTNSRRRGQKYTLFDSFCGAGGVSRGAQNSGFKVQYAKSVDEFIRDTKDRQMRVDVLHLSPPCQYFSPAHTHQSVHDDTNIFALFGCLSLISKLRPRLITLEQTFGITHERHHHYLRALIGDYTQLGYSVRWKVVRLCTWGSSQDRKRLIILAAAPGEKLPPFPKHTHSENGAGGLQPWTTIGKAIGSIRNGDDLHNLDSVKYFHPPRAPLDPNRLAGTITTGGNEVYYPDGTRDLTIREYASIQGFPKYHKFIGTKTCIRKQIGNAFPPNTVRVLYRHLEDWLLQQDGMTRYQPLPDSVLSVDDSDGDNSEHYTGSQTSSMVQSSPEMDEDIVELICPRGRSRTTRHRRSAVVDLT